MSAAAAGTSRVLVVGGAGAIGRAVAAAFAAASWTVIVADRQGAQDAAAALPGAGHAATTVDVTDLASVRSLVADAVARGPLTAVVYAAGTNTTGPIRDLDWADYDRVMGVNLRGAFHLAQALASHLDDGASGVSVVLLASTAGQRGEAGGSVYCASKFGLLGLTESLAAEWAPLGARVNAVCPGNVDSPMLRELARAIGVREGSAAEEVLAAMAAEAAARRLVQVDEVAQACLWLASAAASGVTGTTVNVDAGALVQ